MLPSSRARSLRNPLPGGRPRPVVPRPRRSRVGIPPDVQRVLDVHRELGEAARRALHVSEKVAKRDVENAARAADSLRRRASGRRRS